MTVLVTGASGHLGRLVVDSLLARGAAPAEIVAGARSPQKIEDLAAKGVRMVPLDYDDPATIAAALDGVDRVLLISGSDVGRRAEQHRAVVEAAAAAGVDLLAYTSLGKGADSPLPLAPDHVATEAAIAASGVPAVILRNNWYFENYLSDLERARETGEIAASVGDGRVSGASRADYAEAAAAVLLEDGHAGKVYELAGETAYGYDELADAIGEVIGRPVAYRRLTTEEHLLGLRAAGLDEGTAGFVAALDAGIAAGGLDTPDPTLARLIGHPAATPTEALRAAL